MEEKIRKAVAEALAHVGAPALTFVVEWPADMAHGDFATNAAFAAAKQLGKSPKAIAEELAPHIRESLGSYAETVSVAGPGFINIVLARTVLIEGLERISALGADWGNGIANAGKRIMVEYTDPNPFKEMHIGHLMSNIIGEAMARVIENSGASIVRANYQGDVGPHVARALWGLNQKGITEPMNAKELGNAYVHGTKAYEESPDAKAEIDTLNKQVYIGTDRELMELWRKGRQVSLAAFEEIYKKLGTSFDYYFFESEAAGPGTELVMDSLARGIFEKSQGAIIYAGEKKGLHTLVFITSQGTPAYEAKEIGLAFLKEERWPSDESYILTAAEQIGHFMVVKAALEEVAPLLGAKTHHIPHGFLRLTSGKMSSREGNVITAASLINDVIAKAETKNPDPLIAEQVGIGAIKYMILRQAPGGDIIFDVEQSLSLEGDSGPYLQYALVRAKSVIAQANHVAEETIPDAPHLLERMLIRYPDVAVRAEQERAPHHITQYLTQLASEWNSFYAQERIIGGEHEAYKLAVAKAFVTTMQNGLKVLGIPTSEKM